MMSLSGAKLGTLTEGGFRPYQALQKYDSAGSSARVKQIVASAPDPIRRAPRATFDFTDPIQFQEDFTASRVIDSTWPHQGNTVHVTVRGGQAHQPSSIDKNKTGQWRQKLLQTGMSNGSKQTKRGKRVDAHCTGQLLHGYENISNFVPSLQHSLLL